MGRPKKGQTKKVPAPDERVAIIHLKGTPAYSEWFDEANRKTRIPKTTIVRDAVAEWAKARGLPEPPEM